MKLSEILGKPVESDLDFKGLKEDSRLVETGDVFVYDQRIVDGGEKFVNMAREKGAVAIDGDEVVECGIKQGLKIVDLTGAGDLFAAGFLHGHINNMSLKESLDKGTEMSAKVIQQIGARL